MGDDADIGVGYLDRLLDDGSVGRFGDRFKLSEAGARAAELAFAASFEEVMWPTDVACRPGPVVPGRRGLQAMTPGSAGCGKGRMAVLYRTPFDLRQHSPHRRRWSDGRPAVEIENLRKGCTHFATDASFQPVLLRQRDHAADNQQHARAAVFGRLLDGLDAS